MKKEREITKEFLSLPVPKTYRDNVREEYGLEVEEGTTYRELLKMRYLQLAASGFPEAAKIVEELNFDEH